MLGNPVLLTLAAAVIISLIAGVALWRLRRVFIVDIRAGQAGIRAGKPPGDFLDGCEDVARRHRIDRGRITGVRDGSGIQLRFSREIPERSHQAFRNVWTPPPPRGGPPGGGMRARG